MERHIIGGEAEKHVQAYLEYRMIVGDRDGGVMLPEKEYEKLKKDFYAKREKHGLHFVNTNFLQGKNRRLESGADESKYEASKERGKKTKILKNVSLLELYNR